MNIDGAASATDNRRRTDIWPDWFRDGGELAFTSERTGVPNTYAMKADGTGQRL